MSDYEAINKEYLFKIKDTIPDENHVEVYYVTHVLSNMVNKLSASALFVENCNNLCQAVVQ